MYVCIYLSGSAEIGCSLTHIQLGIKNIAVANTDEPGSL